MNGVVLVHGVIPGDVTLMVDAFFSILALTSLKVFISFQEYYMPRV